MCNCNNIEIGGYGNQVVLNRPTHMIGRIGEGSSSNTICVDACLSEEITSLWSKSIKTTGCCCGHNKLPAYIGVSLDDIEKMIAMGYEVEPNILYPERTDSFKPKTI